MMRVFAYCTRSSATAVRAATGVDPLTSPPLRAVTFDATWMEGYELLYFRLHGHEDREGWFGDWGVEALSVARVLEADLGGAVAVVANCYGGDKDPMVGALYRSGCRAVIAGMGENVAAASRVVGTDLLVRWLIRLMRLGLGVRHALRGARMRLWLTGWRSSDRDAAQFAMIKGGDDDERGAIV